MNTIVYKKFRKSGTDLISWCPPHNCLFHYERDKRNVPAIPGSWFFAFKTFEAALLFDIHCNGPSEVWKCRTQKTCEIKRRLDTVEHYSFDAVVSFWEGWFNGKIWYDVPEQTVGCADLELVEKVIPQSGFFKVVRESRRDARFVSARAREEERATYATDRWTFPTVPNSKLFVFNSFEAAKGFASCSEHTEHIFECEVYNPKELSYVSFLSSNIRSFWSLLKNKKRVSHLRMSAPTGTFGCDAVKLLREVYV